MVFQVGRAAVMVLSSFLQNGEPKGKLNLEYEN